MGELLLLHKRIDIDASPVLYEKPFTPESLAADWEICGGEWHCEDGALLGRHPGPFAFLFSRADFPGNVLLDFHAATVAPSTHDIDVFWNATHDPAAPGGRGTAYVAGIQGWWDGKVGIEKSPDYKFVVNAPSPWFQPGRDYHLQVGSIDGHCFIFVDGELKLECLDPDPIDPRVHARIGFEVYQSIARYSKLVVRQIVWTAREAEYAPEF